MEKCYDCNEKYKMYQWFGWGSDGWTRCIPCLEKFDKKMKAVYSSSEKLLPSLHKEKC